MKASLYIYMLLLLLLLQTNDFFSLLHIPYDTLAGLYYEGPCQ